MNIGEAEDAPAAEGGFVVFFDVGDEPGTAVVAALDPDAAFDLTRLPPGRSRPAGCLRHLSRACPRRLVR